MTPSKARYGFAAHPDALLDLRTLPKAMRDRALLELQLLVHGEGDARPLHGPLAGLHKVYLDPETRWRLVFQYRPTRHDPFHTEELYLVAAGPRQGYAVYRDAQLRLGRPNPQDAPTPQQVALARARSPHALRAQSRARAQQPAQPPSASAERRTVTTPAQPAGLPARAGR